MDEIGRREQQGMRDEGGWIDWKMGTTESVRDEVEEGGWMDRLKELMHGTALMRHDKEAEKIAGLRIVDGRVG
ncbi:hypothetical protein Pcinc_026521 [Petrolisthes cinctipes]|uniref:Uncharacterized protein n=1 Tax=Petrolisthes cinctipes TaxID=88211 RepID=A0AAE1KC56_PETCI|nr:hypothetical protein Pcinc_026521 [Petrolisthes cinctipes]